MCCLAMFVLFLSLPAMADEWNKATIVTFNKPVEIPGMVLKAGTYEFKLLDSPSDRHIVQILNADGTHLYENVLAIPAYRSEPSDKTVVTFEERAQGAPEAISTWFYPGDNSGQEFIYSKVNPVALTAKTSGTPAPPVSSQVVSKSTSAQQQTNAPTAVHGKLNSVPVEQNEPAQLARATTQTKLEASSTAAPPQKQTLKQLPKTASSLPLLAMVGLLSLGGAAGFHVFSKHSAWF
jgi:LPXTG-motif cell wall-anchored protein